MRRLAFASVLVAAASVLVTSTALAQKPGTGGIQPLCITGCGGGGSSEVLVQLFSPSTWADTINVSNPPANATVTFKVKNIGTQYTDTYTLTMSCTGSETCVSESQASATLAHGASVNVTVTFTPGANGTAGAVQLTADDGKGFSDYNSYTVVSVGPPPPPPPTPTPIASLAPYSPDVQDYSRCAAACFAATHAQSTVPYLSLDTPRSITLTYNGDRVDPKPFVHVDVTHGGDATNLPVYFYLKVQGPGGLVQFLNGESELHFAPSAGVALRLGGQFSARANAMGTTAVYNVTVIVGAFYSPGGVKEVSLPTRVIVVNESASLIARGWTIAGVQHLYPQQGGGFLVTEGDGSATSFPAGSTPVGDNTTLVPDNVNGGWIRTYPNGTQVRFNSLGYMTQVTDVTDYPTTFLYDASNRLEFVIDQRNLAVSLSYSSYGLNSIQEALGTQGRATSILVSADTNRLLTTFTDPDGVAARFGYDGSLRLWTVTDRRGSTDTLSYHPTSGKLVAERQPSVTVYGGGSAQPVTTFAPWQLVSVPYVGTSTPYTPARSDTVSGSITDPAGHQVRFTVNRFGQPLLTTAALGDTVSVVRDSAGQALSIVDRLGVSASFTYSASGFVTSKTVGGVATYFRNGGWMIADSIWGPAGPIQRRTIQGGFVVANSIAGYTTLYAYDAYGRISSVTDPAGHLIVSSTYAGVNGNRSKDSMPGGRMTLYGYDIFGRRDTVSSTGVPLRTATYDLTNRPTALQDGVNSTPTSLTYDPLLLSSLTDPRGQTHTFTYNALRWRTGYTDPANQTISYAYDVEGLLRRMTNRRGQQVDLTYDALHRRLARSGSAISPDTLRYGSMGNTLVVSSSNAAATDSVFLNQRMQADSTRTWLTIPGSGRQEYSLRYTYRSSDARPDAMSATGAGMTFFTRRHGYNATRLTLDTIALVSGTSTYLTRFGFNADALPTLTQFPGSDNIVSDLLTTHDMAAIVSAVINDSMHVNMQLRPDLVRFAGDGTQRRYEYDGLGRLSTVTYQTGSPACSWSLDFGYSCGDVPTDSVVTNSYDASGNRTNRSSSISGSASGTYGVGNRISAFAGCNYSTDPDGNVTSRACPSQTVNFTWSADGLLSSLAVVGGATVNFAYDADGRMVRRDVNGAPSSLFLWSGSSLFAELGAGGTNKVAEYDYLGGLDYLHAIISGSTPYYAHADALHNIRGLSNYGTVYRRYSYDEWGELSGGSDIGGFGGSDRARWKGALYLGPEADVYYMRNRWYEPRTGRFLSEDPAGPLVSTNLYSFAGANPVSGSDPAGRSPCFLDIGNVLNKMTFGVFHIPSFGIPFPCGDDTDDGGIPRDEGDPWPTDGGLRAPPRAHSPFDLLFSNSPLKALGPPVVFLGVGMCAVFEGGTCSTGGLYASPQGVGLFNSWTPAIGGDLSTGVTGGFHTNFDSWRGLSYEGSAGFKFFSVAAQKNASGWGLSGTVGASLTTYTGHAGVGYTVASDPIPACMFLPTVGLVCTGQ